MQRKSKLAEVEQSHAQKMRELYQQHHQKLIYHIMKKGLAQREAEDIAQEAFVRLLGVDKPDISNYISAYLYKIANNLTIDKLRSNARSPIYYDDQEQETTPDLLHNPEHTNHQQQLLVKMAELVEELPLKCQQSFILYKVKDKSYSEISELLGVTQSMVRKYVLRAVRHCYDHLQHEL